MTRARLVIGGVGLVVVVAAIVAVAAIGSGDDEDATPSRALGESEAQSDDTTTTIDPDEPLSAPATADDQGSTVATVLEPVAPGEDAPFGTGLVVTVVDVDEVEVEAMGPGSTAGPAVAVGLELRNESGEPIDLTAVAVNARDGDGTPVVPSFASPAEALSGVLDPGGTGAGTYVFRVADGAEGIEIEVQYAGAPNVVIVRL